MGKFLADKGRSPHHFHYCLCHGVILQGQANDVDVWKGFLDASRCLDPSRRGIWMSIVIT